MTIHDRSIPTLDWDSGISISARFEDIAKRNASSVAVKSSQSMLTYLDLKKSSINVANILSQKLGSNPSPVALLLEDGSQVIASILGVIKVRPFLQRPIPSGSCLPFERDFTRSWIASFGNGFTSLNPGKAGCSTRL